MKPDAAQPSKPLDSHSPAANNQGTAAAEPLTPTGDGRIVRARRRRLIFCIVGTALAGFLAAWFMAVWLPDYLLYATPLVQADAAVLILGSDEDARRQQVDELVAKGWVKFVIVPWKGQIFETRVSKALVTPEKTARLARAVRIDFKRALVERTHVEVLQALALMEHMAVKRAVFVSSPYHMRRIKLIAEHVFDGNRYELAYLPTAYAPPHWPWFAHWQDVKWVFSEGVKIGWFFLYSPFV